MGSKPRHTPGDQDWFAKEHPIRNVSAEYPPTLLRCGEPDTVHAHSDAEHGAGGGLGQPDTPFLEADDVAAEVLPIAADSVAPAQAAHGRQGAEHAPFDLLVKPAAPAVSTDDLPVAVPLLATDPIAPMKATHARQDAEHRTMEMPAAAPHAAEELDNAAIRAAWLIAAGVAAPTARARVRQASSSRAAAPVTVLGAAPVVGMNGIGAASMPAAESEDQTIWRRWLANEKTEDMVQALQWALLMQAREAAEARAARAAAGKAANGSKGKAARQPRQVTPMEGMVAIETPIMPAALSPPLASSATLQTTKLPPLEQLLAERGGRRAADDSAAGFEGLE